MTMTSPNSGEQIASKRPCNCNWLGKRGSLALMTGHQTGVETKSSQSLMIFELCFLQKHLPLRQVQLSQRQDVCPSLLEHILLYQLPRAKGNVSLSKGSRKSPEKSCA